MYVVGVLVVLLGGCDLADDKTPERVSNGTNALDVTVPGRPTPGSLALTEHVIARLKARDAEGLARYADADDTARDNAARWMARWGDAARRPATAHFGLGEKDASVDIRFTGERSPMSLLLVPEHEDAPYDDAYVVVLDDGR
ncbi:hypothetical protein J116_005160 [Streptomyces thermolilacinus SPC6]|uniref:DUF3887 domain-containing protein n=1 Tax=Streptomyces thermolilacinus SPC6 TaxID=1306406 RepID=A0A1D3DNR2_9ACTN|nr:hypothetical protein J116_005160 [Streptomyces thermolilacinus SPC6]